MTAAGTVLRLLPPIRLLRVSVLAASVLAAGTIALPSARAQAPGFSFGHSDQPVEILADQDIEWQREQQRYIARGHASAKQGDTTVYADVLTAYYRPQPKPAGQTAAAGAKDPKTPSPAKDAPAKGAPTKAAGANDPKPDPKTAPGAPNAPATGKSADDPQGGTQIFRYEAEGHVRIVTPTDTAVGDKGVYDIDTGVLVLTGHGLKFTTPTETITARDSLEYWQEKQMAVARGDAVVVTQDRRMTGDILTSYFVDNKTNPPPATARNVKTTADKKTTQVADKSGDAKSGDDGQGNNRLQRIEGFGHVHVSTPAEIATADRGVYNADTGIALMSDHVRITRGDNQMDGDFAEVNLNTGINRVLRRGDTQQVRGLFIPQQKQDKDGQKAPAANDKTANEKKSGANTSDGAPSDTTKKANP